jgi:hypothetical protein
MMPLAAGAGGAKKICANFTGKGVPNSKGVKYE